MRKLIACILLAVGLFPGSVSAHDPDSSLLRAAKVGTDGGSSLAFLRERIAADVKPELVQQLINQLADPKVADQAIARLIALGYKTTPALQQALVKADLAKAHEKIRACLALIEGAEAPALTRAVVIQVARQRPDGAVGVLLSFVAAAEDESVAAETRAALAALAVHDGKADPTLLAALKDGDISRRTLAAEALCRADAKGIGRSLLTSPESLARMAIALALADLGDAEAIPVLIDLLAAGQANYAPIVYDRLLHLAGARAPAEPLGVGTTSRTRCRDAWSQWWRATDGTALLAYFRERMPKVTVDQVPVLIAQLGSKSFKIRGQAERDLVNLRGLAAPYLELAAKNPDLEVRRRAERCLEEIRSAPDAPLSGATAKLLALRRPEGAATTLLDFAGFADSDTVVEDLRDALTQLGRGDAHATTVLITALRDRVAVRRRIAAEALLAIGSDKHLPAVRKLLSDADATVRFRVAVGLGRKADRAAVPVLIEFVETGSSEQMWDADDLLRALAGDNAPGSKAALDTDNRKSHRQAWDIWWKANADRITLVAPGSRAALLGYTVVSLWPNGGTNEIVELGRDGKVRWKIEGLGYAFDFVVLPGNRLLLAENNAGRVTERNFRGEILWQFDIPNPLNCQRLPNGNTFIAAGGRVVIVDRAKKPVLDVTRYGISAGQRLNDGHIILCTGSECVHLDAQGNEIGKFKCEPLSNMAAMHAEPNGRILIAYHNLNKVIEYDRDGKVTGTIDTQSPNFANRLPNGNVLVGSQEQKTLVERDRTGRVVWQYNPGTGVWRVRRR